MQIVIDIPDKVYGVLKYFEESMGLADKKDDDVKTALIRAVVNGKLLPGGHGDLIDKSLLYPDSDYDDGLFYAVSIGQINGAQAIIEADKDESENI